MRVDDLERIQHYLRELERLRAALLRITDEAPVHMRLFFYSGDLDLEGGPSVLVSVEDREFAEVVRLARACLVRDLAEVAGVLRELGVNTERV